MNGWEDALRFLSRDPLSHIDMLEPLRRGQAEICFASAEKGVLLKVNGGALWMLSAPDPALGLALLDRVGPGADFFVLHQQELVPEVRGRFGLSTGFDCLQAVYTRRDPPPAPELEIRRLDEGDLGLVTAWYHAVDDEEYLRERLQSGALWGAFPDGRPAGFAGLHGEGSVGMLEVLPGFRRLGIGRALETHMIRRVMARGWTAFGQIRRDNAASLALQRSMGLELSPQPAYWVF